MSMYKKIVIACCCGTRLILIVAVVAQLAYFNSATLSDDLTFDLWPTVVCTQFIQSLSIIMACVPYLKPFFDSLVSGMIRNDDVRRRGLGPEHYCPAPLSRTSPGSAHVEDTWLAAKPLKATIEMDTRQSNVPDSSRTNDSPGRLRTNDGGNDPTSSGGSSRADDTYARLSAIDQFPRLHHTSHPSPVCRQMLATLATNVTATVRPVDPRFCGVSGGRGGLKCLHPGFDGPPAHHSRLPLASDAMAKLPSNPWLAMWRLRQPPVITANCMTRAQRASSAF